MTSTSLCDSCGASVPVGAKSQPSDGSATALAQAAAGP